MMKKESMNQSPGGSKANVGGSSPEWPGKQWPRTVQREGWRRVGGSLPRGLTHRPMSER